MSGDYRGVVGAFPYAFRRSGSWLFRSYVVVSALATLLVGLIVTAGLVVLIANTAQFAGGSLTLSRSFYVVVGLLIVLPMVAPTLLVARRYRVGRAGDGEGGGAGASANADANAGGAGGARYDAALALAGYLFILSVYVGLVTSVPPGQQVAPTGALAPVVRALYDLPAVAGLAFPVLAATAMAVVHRLAR
jgi:hypothetical protein